MMKVVKLCASPEGHPVVEAEGEVVARVNFDRLHQTNSEPRVQGEKMHAVSER